MHLVIGNFRSGELTLAQKQWFWWLRLSDLHLITGKQSLTWRSERWDVFRSLPQGSKLVVEWDFQIKLKKTRSFKMTIADKKLPHQSHPHHLMFESGLEIRLKSGSEPSCGFSTSHNRNVGVTIFIIIVVPIFHSHQRHHGSRQLHCKILFNPFPSREKIVWRGVWKNQESNLVTTSLQPSSDSPVSISR